MTNQTAPGAHADPGVPLPRPVDVARWLWIAGAVIGFVRLLVELGDRSALVAQFRAVAPQLTQEQVDSVTNSGILLAIVISLAILAVYVAIATRMTWGRQWARVVMAVVSGLSVLHTVLVVLATPVLGPAGAGQVNGLDMPAGPLDMVFWLVLVATDIATLALLFRPASNRFFRERMTAHRAQSSPPGPAGH